MLARVCVALTVVNNLHFVQDHEHLGQRGEVVSVAAGYARQALFPRRIADYAVPSVLRELQVRLCV